MGQFIVTNFIGLVAACMVVSVGFMFLVRKLFGLKYLRQHHEVSDPLLACVGTLFAILLGFMVANAMTRSEEARVNAEQEAGAVSDIFRLSMGLPDSIGVRVRTDCLTYVDGVIDDEWPTMAQRTMSQQVWNTYGEIWRDCLQYEPVSQRQNNIHSTMLDSVVRLGDCRRTRATQMSYTLPMVLWVVVLIGAAATGVLILFFGIQSTVMQVCTSALVTLVLCLNVFLLACYDDPFTGEVSVKPEAFRVARTTMLQVLEEKIK
ncbi:MAG: DUF4239 domain-containing protein [Candidatus Obscuribacterales bacterium]|nr:DUF4239 domain-containing protein [Candidatus Obscuribacterales bacterium]